MIDQDRVGPGSQGQHGLLFRALDGPHTVGHTADGDVLGSQRQPRQLDTPEDHQPTTFGVPDGEHKGGVPVSGGGLYRVDEYIQAPIELLSIIARQRNTGDYADQGNYQSGGKEGRDRDSGPQRERAFHGSSRITYPTPRTVWMTRDDPPVSSLRRR